MRRGLIGIVVLTIAAMATFLLPQTAAALLAPLGPVELVWASDRVVQGHVVAIDARWLDDDTEDASAAGSADAVGPIVTDVTLRVDDVVRGDAPSTLTITVPGGSLDGWTAEVEDASAFEEGADYLVFLDATGGVVGWRQGSPTIVDGMVPAFGTSLAAVKADVAEIGDRLDALDARLSVVRGGVEALEHGLLVASGGLAAAGSQGSGDGGGTDDGVDAGSGVAPPAGSVAAEMLALGDAARATIAALPTQAWTLPGTGGGEWTSVPTAADILTPGGGRSEKGSAPTVGSIMPAPQPAKRGGAGRVRGAAPPDYPAGMDAWMVRGPLDLRGATGARLSFRAWHRMPVGLDRLIVACSLDGSSFSGYGITGTSKGFDRYELSFKDWPLLGDLNGKRRVWIAFGFESDGIGSDEGAYIDAVRLITAQGVRLSEDFRASGLRHWRTYGEPSWGRSTHRSMRGGASAYCAGAEVRITAVRPDRRPAGIGGTITLEGSGFGAKPGRVAFFYKKGEPTIRAPIVSWTADRVVCRVPVALVDNYPGSAGSGPLWLTTADGVTCAFDGFQVPFGWDGSWWPSGRIPYHVNATEKRFLVAVRRAAATWNACGADLELEYAGSTTHSDIEPDFQNDVIWRVAHQPGVIAFVRPLSYKGCIVELDQVFNASMRWGNGRKDTMDVETICLHEMGHWLNLRDLYGPGDGERVMYGFGSEGKLRRSLSPGDRRGARWIYAHDTHDTAAPTVTASAARCESGDEVTLRFRVTDPAPSCGWAMASIGVRSSDDGVVEDGATADDADLADLVDLPERLVVRVGRRSAYRFECLLPEGRYVYQLTVRDLAGHRAETASAPLTVD